MGGGAVTGFQTTMPFDPDEWRLAEDVGTRRRRGPDYERWGWPLVAVVGVALAATSVWELATGPLDPAPGFAAEPAFRVGHLALVVALGLAVVALAAWPLRRGERWAWWVLWTVPAAVAVAAWANRSVEGSLWPVQVAVVAVAVVGLLLAARHAFSTPPPRW